MPSVCVAQVLRSVNAPISLSEQHTSCNFESSSEQWRTYATLSSDGQFYQVQQVHATSLECNYNKCTKYIIVESAHLRERERERERCFCASFHSVFTSISWQQFPVTVLLWPWKDQTIHSNINHHTEKVESPENTPVFKSPAITFFTCGLRLKSARIFKVESAKRDQDYWASY